MTAAQLHIQKELDIIGESLKREGLEVHLGLAMKELSLLYGVLSEAYHKGCLHMSVNTHTHSPPPSLLCPRKRSVEQGSELKVLGV